MSASKPPRLFRSSLTGRVYVVRAYKELGDDVFEATGAKYDVTDDFNRLAATAALPPDTEPRVTVCPECGEQMWASLVGHVGPCWPCQNRKASPS